MKARRVVITVEVESNECLANLKLAAEESLFYAYNGLLTDVVQVQANVIKKEK